MRREKDWGFTMLELMIVIEIISIMASLAIPALLRQRIQTNEAAAVQSLRTVSTAQISFNSVNYRYGTFEELCAGVGGTPFLDGAWSQGCVRSEYVYTMENAGTDNYLATAKPLHVGRSGIRQFSVDASGVINSAAAPAGG